MADPAVTMPSAGPHQPTHPQCGHLPQHCHQCHPPAGRATSSALLPPGQGQVSVQRGSRMAQLGPPKLMGSWQFQCSHTWSHSPPAPCLVPGPVCPTVSPHPRAGLRCYNASPAARGWAQGTGEVEDATAGGQAITASALENALPAQTQPGLVGLGLGMELRRPLPAGPRRGASAAAPAAPVGTCQETRDHEEKRTPNGC